MLREGQANAERSVASSPIAASFRIRMDPSSATRSFRQERAGKLRFAVYNLEIHVTHFGAATV
jgi:hypothetical protein